MTLPATKSFAPQRVGTTPAPGWNKSRSSLESSPQTAGSKLRSAMAGAPQRARNLSRSGLKNFRHLVVVIGFRCS